MRKTLWAKSLQRLFVAALLLILTACQKMLTTRTGTSSLTEMPTSTWPTCRRESQAEWQVWEMPHGNGSLVSDGQDIWFSNNSGTYRIHPQTLTYTHYTDVASARILLPVDVGQLWAVTNRTMLYFDGQRWIQPKFAQDQTDMILSTRSLQIDSAGNLWLNSTAYRSNWWIQYPGHVPPAAGVWTPSARNSSEFPPLYACDQWQAFSDGRLTYTSSDMCRRMQAEYPDAKYNRQTVFALPETGADRWEIREGVLRHVTPITVTTMILPVSCFEMAADPVNGVWMNTAEGIFYANDEGVQHLEIFPGKNLCVLPGEPRDIAVDAAGNLWATTANGLFQLAPNSDQWEVVYDTHVQEADRARPPYYLATAPDGNVWASHGWDLWQVNQMVPKTPAGVTGSCAAVNALTIDPSGNIWTALGECGILQYRPAEDTWVVHPLETNVRKLSSGVAGVMYAYTWENVFVYNERDGGTAPAAWVPVGPERSEWLYRTSDIAADRQGGVWIKTDSSSYLWHIQDSRVITVPIPTTNPIHALYVDPQDHLWFQGGQKLYHYDGMQFTVINLPISHVQKLTFAADGRVWMLGLSDIAVYNPDAAR